MNILPPGADDVVTPLIGPQGAMDRQRLRHSRPPWCFHDQLLNAFSRPDMTQAEVVRLRVCIHYR